MTKNKNTDDRAVMGKLKRSVPPKTSHDNYCPACRENIGWPALSQLFKQINPLGVSSVRYTCPHCDSVLRVDALIDFQLTEVG